MLCERELLSELDAEIEACTCWADIAPPTRVESIWPAALSESV